MGVVPMGAELPWMPQFVLALPDLTWSDTGDTTFEVRADAAGQKIAVTFELDREGEITRARSTRPYDIPGGFVEAPWRCEFSNYRSFDDVRIPTSAVATYEKSDGDWTYWRGETTPVKENSAHA